MALEGLVKRLADRAEVRDPEALAAWIGRKKHGDRAFAKLAAAGRSKAVTPDFGKPYGARYATPSGSVRMFRKGQKVRFFNSRGKQVGPEQSNVAPAVAYAVSRGWRHL